MDLRNKVVVITGASKGLGKALAFAFAKEGARVVLGARSKGALKAVADQLNVQWAVTDVRDEAQVLKLADTAVSKYGRIDVWVNNAGTRVPHALIEEMDMKRVQEMIAVNLFGMIYGSKAALVQMKRQGFGTIVNILSSAALTGRAGASGYVASKHAAAGFTKSIRLEAKSANILVVGVYPGGMQTNFFDEQKPDDYGQYMDPAEVARKIIENLKADNPQEELMIRRPKK